MKKLPWLEEKVPSPELAAVIGSKRRTRPKTILKVWQYIKNHNLQDPRNRRNIIADDKLAALFKKDQVTMFELSKIITKNLYSKKEDMFTYEVVPEVNISGLL